MAATGAFASLVICRACKQMQRTYLESRQHAKKELLGFESKNPASRFGGSKRGKDMWSKINMCFLAGLAMLVVFHVLMIGVDLLRSRRRSVETPSKSVRLGWFAAARDT